MKVLVTGATGFIGSYVVKELLRQGHTVVASSVSESKAREKDWYPAVTYIPFELSQLKPGTDYYAFFGRPDLLIHLAWEGLPNYSAPFHVEENLPRHFAFLENVVLHGLRDVTITGTCLEYGLQEGSLKENMDTLPTTAYGQAKDLLRRRMEELRRHTPFSFKWVRLFYMYGEGQHPKSLLSQLDTALSSGAPVFNMSGGEQVRDFLPVAEVASDMVAIALQREVEGIINCSSNQPVTVKQFVENYLDRTKSSIRLNLGYYPYPAYEPMRFWGDNAKLKTILKNE